MRLYDVIMQVVLVNAPHLKDAMLRHRLVEALEQELRSGSSGWVVLRKPVPRRFTVKKLFSRSR